MTKNVKNIIKLSFLIVALFALVALCLVACNNAGQNPGDETTSADNIPTQSEGGALPDEVKERIAALLKGKLGDYQLVRNETMKDDELKVVLSFVNIVNEYGGGGLKPVSDYEKLAPVKDNEIIVGDTSRKGSVYSIGEGVIYKTDLYMIQIVGTRLIFTYEDQKGMMDGLEAIMLCLVDGDEATIIDDFDVALFERGITRYAFDGFTLKNQINNGTRLSSNSDTLFLGTAAPNSSVKLQLSKGFKVEKEFETVANDKGIWEMKVSPSDKSDTIIVRLNGKISYKYDNVKFVKNEISTGHDGTKVYINGTQVDVYSNDGGNYVMYTLPQGVTKADVKIIRPSTEPSCTVRPTSEGIVPQINGRTITFTVNEVPAKLSVEFDDFHSNDNVMDSVQLFLYEYEEFKPDLENRELLYFAPGEYTFSSNISLKSNTTVYIAEGAVLHARFNVKNAENVVIEGRGIIDTFCFGTENGQATNMMVFEQCTNLTLKDYFLTGPRKWMTVLTSCDTCLLDSVNIMGTLVNSDGIDVVGSKNVTIQNCFLRTNDDCIAVKSHATDVENLKVTKCVFWNMKYGNALEIGYETRCESISNISFVDNDIIHIPGGACMSIHLGDRAHVKNILYDNIRIEDSQGKLIEFFIKDTQYTKDAEKGHISDITIRNIHLMDDSTVGQLIFEGYDADNIVKNVDIGVITYDGRALTVDRFNIIKNKFTSNIKYNGTAI